MVLAGLVGLTAAAVALTSHKRPDRKLLPRPVVIAGLLPAVCPRPANAPKQPHERAAWWQARQAHIDAERAKKRAQVGPDGKRVYESPLARQMQADLEEFREARARASAETLALWQREMAVLRAEHAVRLEETQVRYSSLFAGRGLDGYKEITVNASN